MTYEVLKPFRDKETGRLLLPGQSFSSEDEKRTAALIKKGLLAGSELPSTESKKTQDDKAKHVPPKRTGLKPAAGDDKDAPAE